MVVEHNGDRYLSVNQKFVIYLLILPLFVLAFLVKNIG